jgi:hypothetical protein
VEGLDVKYAIGRNFDRFVDPHLCEPHVEEDEDEDEVEPRARRRWRRGGPLKPQEQAPDKENSVQPTRQKKLPKKNNPRHNFLGGGLEKLKTALGHHQSPQNVIAEQATPRFSVPDEITFSDSSVVSDLASYSGGIEDFAQQTRQSMLSSAQRNARKPIRARTFSIQPMIQEKSEDNNMTEEHTSMTEEESSRDGEPDRNIEQGCASTHSSPASNPVSATTIASGSFKKMDKGTSPVAQKSIVRGFLRRVSSV